MVVTVLVKRLDPHSSVHIPKFAYDSDACADIESNAEVSIPPGEMAIVPTGLAFQIPLGYEIQVRPRSGLAVKHGITLVNSPGTIDSEYRGEVKIILINLGKETFHIHKGDRIAQIAVRPVPDVQFMEVEELNFTERGQRGFGSTGVSG